MLMAAQLHASAAGALHLLGGYEDGRRARIPYMAAHHHHATHSARAPPRRLRLWDVRSPRAPLLAQQLHSEPLMALALDARGVRGASGAADAQARMQHACTAACGGD